MTPGTSVSPISEQFKLAFSRQPHKIAVKSGSRAYTFEELNHCSARLGRYFFERLGETATPLAFFLQDPVDIIAAIIGAMRSGHSYSVLSEKNPPARLNSILVDLEAKILLTDSELLPVARLVAPVGCVIVNISDVPEFGDDNFYRQDLSTERVGIYYTSGSTGEPKGVMRLHSVIVSRLLAEIALDKLGPDDFSCITSPFSASASLDFFASFFSGATCVVCEIDKQGFSELKRILQHEKIKVFHCPIQPLRQFLPGLSDNDLFPDLRLLFPFGDVIYRRDVENLRMHLPSSTVIVVTFSSSEIGIMARNVIHHNTRLETDKLLAGYPAKNKEILLLDEHGREVPNGEIGEIVVRSDQPFHGYWKRPDLAAEKFIADPVEPSHKIFRSGDLGRFHPDGQLESMGRKDFRVKIRGFSVDLPAIENVLMSHAGVQRAVVVAAVDPAGQKRLVAYVLPVEGTPPVVRQLLDLVSVNLPSYMVPALIMIVSDLPLGLTGKVDRKALPAPLWDEITSSTPFMAPVNEIEAKLTAIWNKTLRLQRIGINDNFFELGGDSLMAMQLLLSIEQGFSRKMPFAIISKASTIKQQAEILYNEGLDQHASVLLPIQTNGDKKPLYCIGGKGGLPIRFNNLLKFMSGDQPVYFFRSRGFEFGEQVADTIEGIAADYVFEIKKVQPLGPYHLLGESSGGLVAYEMAQQLYEQGQETAFLGMLDTYLPNRIHEGDLISAKWFTLVKKHWQTLSSGGFRGFRTYIEYYLELWKFKSYQLRIWVNEKWSRWRFGDMPNVFSRVDKANSIAIRAYHPRPYPGSLVMFRAFRQAQFDGQNLDNGWGDVGVGKIVVHQVDCYHGNILFEPFVRQVAEKVNRHLSGNPVEASS